MITASEQRAEIERLCEQRSIASSAWATRVRWACEEPDPVIADAHSASAEYWGARAAGLHKRILSLRESARRWAPVNGDTNEPCDGAGRRPVTGSFDPFTRTGECRECGAIKSASDGVLDPHTVKVIGG